MRDRADQPNTPLHAVRPAVLSECSGRQKDFSESLRRRLFQGIDNVAASIDRSVGISDMTSWVRRTSIRETSDDRAWWSNLIGSSPSDVRDISSVTCLWRVETIACSICGAGTREIDRSLAVRAQQSLVFVYAKRTPLIDDDQWINPRRGDHFL